MDKTRNTALLRANLFYERWARNWMSLLARYAIALVLIAFAITPALWVVSSSLNPAKSLGSGSFWPKHASLINYDQLLNNPNFPYLTWFENSLKIASITTVCAVTITCLAGYALSRFRFRGRQQFMVAILILNVFPAILAMVAIFSTMQQLGMYLTWLGLDTHAGLILIYTAGAMGINVLMVKAYTVHGR
jgi:arabinogalactan oligomer/maltooligosaccharide transport system permease protein